ncbi:MAG: eukaryotic-like serine/threonine-protein kinase [Solirubrobacteraceae bacterium]|nr:eukaryotic-like serine/threonine-protein kinase [Solirubrobacteraceae bacterium]
MPLAGKIELPPRYRVARHIASGGMASVWEAEDLVLGRIVAVKVLGAHYAADPGARARFQREARTAARVSDQSHVVTIYDIGEHGNDAFIVMEHFAGGTVADRLRAAREAGERVPRATALRWLREAAAGLDVAHATGIVHRDVKPANLLLDAQGRLAVGDFGIARLADDTHMTQTGQVLGTAAYLSPEQALGRPATDASDRYALAVVAYELLTGTRPFAGGPPSAQALQHVEEQPARASQVAADLPPALDAVFERGLAKDPSRRPRTATELVAAIERSLGAGATVEPTRPIAAVAANEPFGPMTPAPPRSSDPLAARPVRQLRPEAPRPAAPAGGQPRRSPGISPLVPIGIAGAVVGVILALLLVGGGDDNRQAASQTTARTRSTPERTQPTPLSSAAETAPAPPAQPAQTAPATEAPPTQTAPPTTTTTKPKQSTGAPAPKDLAALNERGHALSQAGDYAEAIPLLRASVAGYRSAGRTKEIGFAYALFNYASALNRSGDPAAAVPLLRERLNYDDQPGTVRRELDDALARLRGAKKKPKQQKGGM